MDILDGVVVDYEFIGVMDRLSEKGWDYEIETSGAYFFNGSYEGKPALMKLYKKDFFETEFGKATYEREKEGLRVCTEENLSGFLYCFSEGDVDDVPYFILNRFRGKGVGDLLVEGKVINPHLGISAFFELANDLSGLHERGYIHLDIKPLNLLLTKEGFKILDLGLVSPQGFYSRNGKSIGSPAYMSPEQVKNKQLFSTSDVYSLGISFYHMLTGLIPSFEDGKTLPDVVNWHLRRAPVPLKDVQSNVPDGLNKVVMKCLEKEPFARYRNGKKVAEALRRIS